MPNAVIFPPQESGPEQTRRVWFRSSRQMTRPEGTSTCLRLGIIWTVCPNGWWWGPKPCEAEEPRVEWECDQLPTTHTSRFYQIHLHTASASLARHVASRRVPPRSGGVVPGVPRRARAARHAQVARAMGGRWRSARARRQRSGSAPVGWRGRDLWSVVGFSLVAVGWGGFQIEIIEKKNSNWWKVGQLKWAE